MEIDLFRTDLVEKKNALKNKTAADINYVLSETVVGHLHDLMTLNVVAAFNEGYEEGFKDWQKDSEKEQKKDGEEWSQDYIAGLNDMCETVMDIVMCESERSNAFTDEELESEYGFFSLRNIVKYHSATEIISIAKGIREKRKQEEDKEIRVGDEVNIVSINTNGQKHGVATMVSRNGWASVMFPDGYCMSYQTAVLFKTGRHFDVAGFLKQMEGEKE